MSFLELAASRSSAVARVRPVWFDRRLIIRSRNLRDSLFRQQEVKLSNQSRRRIFVLLVLLTSLCGYWIQPEFRHSLSAQEPSSLQQPAAHQVSSRRSQMPQAETQKEETPTEVKLPGAVLPATEPPVADSAELSEDDFNKNIKPFLTKYCLQCHTGDDNDSGLDLAHFESMPDMAEDLETWSTILDVLEQDSMPPPTEPQPDAKEIDFVLSWILETIKQNTEDANPPSVIRRLNRVEYENTIRDLFRMSRDVFTNGARIVQTEDYFKPASGKMPRYVLAITYFVNSHRRHSDLPDLSPLPVDPPVEHGFANEHTTLSMSPVLMENYFDIASALVTNPEFEELSGLWESLFVGHSETVPGLLAQAKKQLASFLPRAFRRPIADDELKRYLKLFESKLDRDPALYTPAMQTTISASLASPNFLYRKEYREQAKLADDEQLEHQFALASRLSYFLWASMPDDHLFQAAKEGRLSSSDSLTTEVTRMMNDKKIKSLSTDFGMQWLKLQKAASASPDKDMYPDYYRKDVPPPAISMMVEQMLLFETIMVENRSIVEFITADFGYVNRALMDWYYLDPKNVLGFTPKREDFEDYYRIKWPTPHRGGVIASGAMLVSTSTTKRSSPVLRGAWILDVVFNQPPPAPPADVKPLVENEETAVVHFNVREKLEEHRKNPACASCHDRMDPLGFAFEKYNAVGQWQKKYENGDDIDTRGNLKDDVFDGSSQFKAVMSRHKDDFVKAFVEHTMKYALGRQLHFSDELEIRRITEEVLKEDCHFDSVIKNVVLSKMFRLESNTSSN